MAGRGRPREFDAECVLEDALRLFWKQGFEGTHKRDLLAATGLASQSLYNAFGDKRALYLAVLDAYAERVCSHLEEQLEGSDPLGRLRAYLRSLGGRSRGNARDGCLLCNAAAEFGRSDREVNAILRRALQRRRRALLGCLERACEQGQAIPAPTDGLEERAAALLAGIDGIALLRRAGVPQRLVDQAVSGLLTLLEAPE